MFAVRLPYITNPARNGMEKRDERGWRIGGDGGNSTRRRTWREERRDANMDDSRMRSRKTQRENEREESGRSGGSREDVRRQGY